jgi:hypothetical protein
VGAEVFRVDGHTEGHTDRPGETNGRFSQFGERSVKQLFSIELQVSSNFN